MNNQHNNQWYPPQPAYAAPQVPPNAYQQNQQAWPYHNQQQQYQAPQQWQNQPQYQQPQQQWPQQQQQWPNQPPPLPSLITLPPPTQATYDQHPQSGKWSLIVHRPNHHPESINLPSPPPQHLSKATRKNAEKQAVSEMERGRADELEREVRRLGEQLRAESTVKRGLEREVKELTARSNDHYAKLRRGNDALIQVAGLQATAEAHAQETKRLEKEIKGLKVEVANEKEQAAKAARKANAAALQAVKDAGSAERDYAVLQTNYEALRRSNKTSASSSTALTNEFKEQLETRDDCVKQLEKDLRERDGALEKAANKAKSDARERKLIEDRLVSEKALHGQAMLRRQKEVEEAKGAVKEMKGERSKLTEELGRLKESLARSEGEVRTLEGRVERRDGLITEKDGELASLGESFETFKADTQLELDQISELETSLHDSKSEITTHLTTISHRDTLLTSLTAQLKESNDLLVSLGHSTIDFTAYTRQATLAAEAQSNASSQLATLQSQLDLLQTQHTALQKHSAKQGTEIGTLQLSARNLEHAKQAAEGRYESERKQRVQAEDRSDTLLAERAALDKQLTIKETEVESLTIHYADAKSDMVDARGASKKAGQAATIAEKEATRLEAENLRIAAKWEEDGKKMSSLEEEKRAAEEGKRAVDEELERLRKQMEEMGTGSLGVQKERDDAVRKVGELGKGINERDEVIKTRDATIRERDTLITQLQSRPTSSPADPTAQTTISDLRSSVSTHEKTISEQASTITSLQSTLTSADSIIASYLTPNQLRPADAMNVDSASFPILTHLESFQANHTHMETRQNRLDELEKDIADRKEVIQLTQSVGTVTASVMSAATVTKVEKWITTKRIVLSTTIPTALAAVYSSDHVPSVSSTVIPWPIWNVDTAPSRLLSFLISSSTPSAAFSVIRHTPPAFKTPDERVIWMGCRSLLLRRMTEEVGRYAEIEKYLRADLAGPLSEAEVMKMWSATEDGDPWIGHQLAVSYLHSSHSQTVSLLLISSYLISIGKSRLSSVPFAAISPPPYDIAGLDETTWRAIHESGGASITRFTPSTSPLPLLREISRAHPRPAEIKKYIIDLNDPALAAVAWTHLYNHLRLEAATLRPSMQDIGLALDFIVAAFTTTPTFALVEVRVFVYLGTECLRYLTVWETELEDGERSRIRRVFGNGVSSVRKLRAVIRTRLEANGWAIHAKVI